MTDKSPKAKGERLIAYFETAILPTARVIVRQGVAITDTQRMVEININILKKADPRSHYFRSAYFNLFHLKKYIENAKL